MTSELLNHFFLSNPRYTVTVKGRKVLSVDGAYELLRRFPDLAIQDPHTAKICQSKIEAAERIKEHMRVNTDDVEPSIRTGRVEHP